MPQVNESMLEPIRIKDDGRMVLLDYASFLAYHGGGALAGATIGFRAMACAAVALSPTELWDRKDLSVTTQHGGSGVRDAIEFVTRCVTRGRFRLDERTERDGPCMSPATFQFAVIDGRRLAHVALRTGVLTPQFFDAAGRCAAGDDSDEAGKELAALKNEAAAKVIALPMAELFTLQTRDLQEHDMSEHA